MARMSDKSMCVLWPDLIIHTHETNQNKDSKRPLTLNCTSLTDVLNYLKDIGYIITVATGRIERFKRRASAATTRK